MHRHLLLLAPALLASAQGCFYPPAFTVAASLDPHTRVDKLTGVVATIPVLLRRTTGTDRQHLPFAEFIYQAAAGESDFYDDGGTQTYDSLKFWEGGLGFGRVVVDGRWMGNDTKWRWCSAGVTLQNVDYNEAILTADVHGDDWAPGMYATAGVYNPLWGGVVARLCLAAPVDLGFSKASGSSIGIYYWWGKVGYVAWGTYAVMGAVALGAAH